MCNCKKAVCIVVAFIIVFIFVPFVMGITADQIPIWRLRLEIIGSLVAVIGAFAGAIKYLEERERDRKVRSQEISWQKTKFIFELSQNFDNDEHFRRALKIIEFEIGMPDKSSLKKILSSDINSLNIDEREARFVIDRYLDFFDRLYHFTFVTRSIKPIDLACFLYYLRDIEKIQEIKEYAIKFGFEDTLTLYKELEKITD